MASIMHYVEQRLKLKVSREKSVVDRATKRPFLGFGFRYSGDEVKVTVAPKAQKRVKERLRQLTSRRWGVSMERRIEEINRFTVGWTAYYSYADTPWPFEKLDKWLRRRLRQVRWKQWRRVRTKRRKLIALGIPPGDAHKWACSRKGYWRISSSPILHRALPAAYWTNQGLNRFGRLIWPRFGRLIWPHLRPIVAGRFWLLLSQAGGRRGDGFQSGALRADQARSRSRGLVGARVGGPAWGAPADGAPGACVGAAAGA
jgi:hypothetical protein